MKKLAIIFAIIVIAAVGIYLFWPHTSNQKNTTTTPPSSSSSQSPTKAEQPANQNAVTIQNFAFAPASITVKKGTTVTWTNQDAVKHDVMSDDGSPAGGPSGPLLAKGETYSFTFDTVGTFHYHCSPHPYMKGTVTVTE